jgi:hypothetical protein
VDGVVNSSHGLKAGASLLLLRFCAVIALWHRGTFCGNFRFFVSLAQTYTRFAVQRFRSHRTGSGCSLPTIVARITPGRG